MGQFNRKRFENGVGIEIYLRNGTGSSVIGRRAQDVQQSVLCLHERSLHERSHVRRLSLYKGSALTHCKLGAANFPCHQSDNNIQRRQLDVLSKVPYEWFNLT
ncbi:hypothetical protein EVAR_29630_1 [Eumeta japonica]|uniref:Uncharacterized protein n=1 Tax=Eumeta variegata TaxID=151549 RepID=A0A4C1W6P5_EUMVA|nr:hypothetical protein EVAR_29630_1 [Eumeta japonica]